MGIVTHCVRVCATGSMNGRTFNFDVTTKILDVLSKPIVSFVRVKQLVYVTLLLNAVRVIIFDRHPRVVRGKPRFCRAFRLD